MGLISYRGGMNAVASKLQPWFNAALAFVYPETCQLCGEHRAKPTEGLVCADCCSHVRFIKPPFCDRCGLPFDGDITTPFQCTNCRELKFHFTSARSAVIAGGVVLEAIHRYKYQQALWFEPFLTDLFLREAMPALRDQRWDGVVPVPLYPAKKREREFNQADRLATHLAAGLNIPLRRFWLRRTLPTATQTRLTREQRAVNVRRAFALRPGVKLPSERLILVDDVFTTGATTNACAGVLLDAGACEVCVWTVARGL